MIELKIGQLNTNNAQNGNVLTYVAANGVVEYRDIVSEIDARIVANVNTVQNNVAALDNNAWVNANDYATYITVTTNTYNTYASLIAYVDGELSNLVSGAPATLDTLNELAAALGNDANLSVTLTGMIGNVAANAATNATNINTVQENVASLDTTVTANTYNTYTTITANLFNTYSTLNNRVNLVQDNVTTLTATTAANDYNTYTTLRSNIDSVQANVYALTLDTVTTNGNTTTQSIEVAGLLSSGDLTVSGPTNLNSNVTIRGMIDAVDRIQFNTTVNADTTTGMLAWNSDAGTLQFGLSDAATVRLGQDTFYYVKAGEALSRGNVVYASGAVGGSGNIEVSKYYANNTIDEQYVVGIMADDVASGEFGYATVIGTVRGLVADGSSVGESWNLGDVLYPSPTVPGALTKIQPEAPNQDIAIAFVTSNSSVNGAIAVRATSTGYKLGDLHDVQTGTESNGDVLTWIAANSRWEPTAVAGDQANVYNTYLTLSANDYSTYSTLSSLINTVQDNVAALGGTADLISDQFVVSTTNSFTLSSSVSDANNIIVSLDGIVQSPNDDYIVSGTTLTFNNTEPLYSGLELEVRHLTGGSSGGGGGGIALTDLSVTTATASGNGALSYDNTSGVFTFTPADTSTGGGGGGITTGKAIAMAMIFGG
jgi:hypothetical protein